MNVQINKVDITTCLKEGGFTLNPHTHKWSRSGVNTLHGELPSTYISDNVYSHGNIYVRKKVD